MACAWGKGPKFYKGSAKDTAWNKDLLWRLYVKEEAKLMKSQYCGTGQTTEDYRSVPPHMRSVTKAIAKSPVGRERITKAKVQEKMFADARTPPSQEELDKRRSDRLRNRFADNQFEDDISSARSIATEKSSRGVLPVSPVTHRSSASRMSEVPHGLHKSHSMPVVERIDSLERMLLAEKTERESLKQELERERQQREESYAEMQKTQYKMKAYDNIMKGLLNSIKNVDHRRK